MIRVARRLPNQIIWVCATVYVYFRSVRIVNSERTWNFIVLKRRTTSLELRYGVDLSTPCLYSCVSTRLGFELDQPSITDAELLLSKILPPKSALALGAVMPQQLQRISELGAASITLVHPDEGFLQQVIDAPKTQDLDVQSSQQAISPMGGDVTVFKNSIDRETGLVSAETLKPLWKNLEQTSQTKVSSIALLDFIHAAITSFNWLIVDRLDGLEVLKAAADCLTELHVIYLRTWNETTTSDLSTSEAAIDFLSANGFVLMARSPERHPALETLLFARNCAGSLQQLAAYEGGEDSEAEKRRKIAQNNLAALEQRYSDLLVKNKKTEKLVAEILARLSRAETALESDD